MGTTVSLFDEESLLTLSSLPSITGAEESCGVYGGVPLDLEQNPGNFTVEVTRTTYRTAGWCGECDGAECTQNGDDSSDEVHGA